MRRMSLNEAGLRQATHGGSRAHRMNKEIIEC
jgi:hypothetical protein